MNTTIKVQGLKGTIFYRLQPGESAATQYKRIRRMIGKVSEWAPWAAPIGFARAYDAAAATMPRTAAEAYAEYLRGRQSSAP